MRTTLLLALVFAAHGAIGAESKQGRSIEDIFRSASAVRAIREADTVRMWRLSENGKRDLQNGAKAKVSKQSDDERAQPWANSLRRQHEPVGPGVKLESVEIKALKGMLLAPASYSDPQFTETGEPILKGCGFRPITLLKFAGPAGKIEIWICFFCSDLFALDDTQVLGGGEFNSISRELLALVKSVLKDDPVIAKIPAR